MSQPKKDTTPTKEKTSSDSSSDSGDEGGLVFHYEDEEQAIQGRKDGLALYNRQKFDEAQDFQAAVCEYYSRIYGDTAKESALPYLDYGLTLLALFEARDASDAVMGGLVENSGNTEDEDSQHCLTTLGIAQLGFEKCEKANPKDQAIQKRLIEVHDAMGALMEESGEEEQAIQEYQLVKAMNAALDEPSKKSAYTADLCMARCHAKNESWEAAMEHLKPAMAKVAEDPEADDVVTQTIQDTYDEVKEMLDRGGMEDLKEEIRNQFPDEDSQVLDPEATLNEVANTNAFVTPLPSDLANHNKCVSNSVPIALMAPIAPKEGSNSISFIQPLGGIVPTAGGAPNPGAPRTVNVVAVRKKTKSNSQSNGHSNGHAPGSPGQKRERSAGGDENSGAPPTKKARTE